MKFYSRRFPKLAKHVPKFILFFMLKMLELKCGGMVSHVLHSESNVAPTFYII